MKRVRQNMTRRLRNRSRKHMLKTLTRKFLASVASGNTAQAEQQFRTCAKMFDRIAAKGTIHKRTAARHKSRLAAKLNRMKAKSAATA